MRNRKFGETIIALSADSIPLSKLASLRDWRKNRMGVFKSSAVTGRRYAHRDRRERMRRAHASSSPGVLGRLVNIRRRLGVSPGPGTTYGPVIDTWETAGEMRGCRCRLKWAS